jgi:hypothetical protein
MDLKRTTDIDSSEGADWARRLARCNALLLGALAAHTVEHLVREPSGPSGFATSAGPLLAHAVPRWGPFSLPYDEGDADVLSWALLFGVATAGVGVGIAGVQARRELGARRRSQRVAQPAEEARAYA